MISCDGRGSLKRNEHALALGSIAGHDQHLIIADGKPGPPAFAHGLENQPIANSRWDAQTSCYSSRIRTGPRFGLISALMQRSYQWSASFGLHNNHFGKLPVLQPAQFAQFREGYTHTNNTCAAPGRVDNRTGQTPAKLFGQL